MPPMKPTQPPAAASRVRGKLPHTPGSLVFTEAELKVMAAEGWKPGMPLPDNVTKAQQAVRQEMRTAPPPNVAPAVIPPETPLEDLPPSQRQDIRNLIAEFRRDNQMPTAPVAPPTAAPATTALPASPRTSAIPAGGDAGEVPRVFSSPSVERAFDDLMHGRVETLDEPEETPASPQTTATPPSEEAPTDAPAGAQAALTQCPHCNHDLSADPAVVTDDDKVRFVAAVLSGKRFTRVTETLQGRLRVVWRSLNVAECELVVRQVARDVAAGKIGSAAEVHDRILLYRMVLGLESLSTPDTVLSIGVAVDHALAADTSQAAFDADSPLPDLLTRIRATVPLCTESIWRLLAGQCQQFMRVQERLEAMADTESF